MNPFSASIPRAFLSTLLLSGLALFALACGSDDPSDGDSPESTDIAIQIDSPEHESYHARRQVIVEGTADNVDQIDLNGETVNVIDGQFDQMLTFDDDGHHTITASAEDVEESLDVIIDTHYPEVIIESPARGTMIDADADDSGEVMVRGQLGEIGPSELLYINVGGTLLSQSDDLDDDGAFEIPVEIREGLNTITVDVMDNAQNQTENHRALIYGPLQDAHSPVDEALRLDIDNPTGLDAISELIDAVVQPELLDDFLEQGLDIQDGISVDIDELSWDSVDVQVTPQDGYLELSLTIHNLLLDGAFNLGDGTTNGSIAIGELTVDLDLAITPSDAGDDLQIDILDDDIDLNDISVDVDGQNQSWAEPLLAAAISFAFDELLNQLLGDNLFDSDWLTQEIELLGRTLTLTLIIEDILISTSGIVAYVGLEFPGDVADGVADLPGALHRPRPSGLVANIERPFLLHTHRTAVDRILHALFNSGLIHQNLGGDELDGVDLPIDLTAGGLAALMDSRIRSIHDSDTPAELHLQPLLPPVTTLTNDPSAIIQIGDLLIDFKLRPEPGNTTHFLTVALQAEALVDFNITDDGLDLDIDLELEGNVIDAPLFDISEDDSVGVLQTLLGLIPNLLGDQLAFDADIDLGIATISDLVLDIQERQRISLGLNLEANEDFDGDFDFDLD